MLTWHDVCGGWTAAHDGGGLYSVSLLSISGVAFLRNFQKLKAWLTPTMATSS
jgi:hypothetical protein